MSDYQFHISSEDYKNLMGDESDMSFAHGFGDDDDEINKAIEEELGDAPRRRSRRKK